MKKLIVAFIICLVMARCVVDRDLSECEPAPARLLEVEGIERWGGYGMRVFELRQTWEFLDTHQKIFRYVDPSNRQQVGIIEPRDRYR